MADALITTGAWTLAGTLVAVALLWAASVARRDASIVDVYWGAGFALIAAAAWTLNSPRHARPLLALALTTIWGARLAIYLAWRKRGAGEDRRYAALRRRQNPGFWWKSLFTVFALQGLLLWFVSWPVQAVIALDRPSSWGWLDALGAGLWVIGFAFETVGDWQMARFKANPANAGAVLDRGLWRYTRHPNYFGDFCVWWGLYSIAAAGGAAATAASPVVMSVLLLKVSGVALLEKSMNDRRPAYAAYQRRTNAFFPGPPRRDAS